MALKHSPQTDWFQMLFEGVLLVSPAYNFSFISFLENVFDLENALFKKNYSNKPIVSTIVVENPFATN